MSLTYHHHSFYFKLYCGEVLIDKKATWPPFATRTTNKEMSAESFMTKMTLSISQSKVHVLRFEKPSFYFYIIHLSSP